MTHKFLKQIVFVICSVLIGSYSTLLAKAQGSSLLPEEIESIFELLGPNGSGAVQFLVSRVQIILYVIIGGIILLAVGYSLINAVKYIRSEGDQSKIDEAGQAVKAIFYGVAAMIVSIIGMILIFVFFGVPITRPEAYQVCVSAPGSVGCDRCKKDSASGTCKFCEEVYKAESARRVPDINEDGVINHIDLRSIVEIANIQGSGKNCLELTKGGNILAQ